MNFLSNSSTILFLILSIIGNITAGSRSAGNEVSPISATETQQIESCLKQDDEVQVNCNNAKSTILDDTFLKSTLNLPEWYRRGDWGLKKSLELENIRLYKDNRHGDNEEKIAWNNFFFGTTSGIMLEFGAVDGKKDSVSKFFEGRAGWRSILIEGNPQLSADLPKNRPKAINFNAVICEKPRIVHFVQYRGVGGIVEFMGRKFLKKFHPNLLGMNGQLDVMKLETEKNVIKVPCVPLSQLLHPLNIFHINFFVLDVEGGELDVLKGIDFEKIKFDVISVETHREVDSKKHSKNYADSVIQFLTSKGYLLWNRKIGRNSWFTHPDFQGFSKNKKTAQPKSVH